MSRVEYATCRNCDGSGNYYTKSGKRLDCKKCKGKGYDESRWQSVCPGCYTTMVYKAGQDRTYCRDCSREELTTTCSQWGCTNQIRYKRGWSEVPEYCKSCYGHNKRGDTPRTCEDCSTLIWVPYGKNFTKCRDCNQRDRDRKEAQWRTTYCKECRSEIKYHVDWDRIPDMCKSCKAEAKAKWREKSCQHCGGTIKYNTDWDKIPDYCKSCNAWLEKTCAAEGCSNTVRYKRYWEHPPSVCKDCKGKKKGSSSSSNVIGKFETLPGSSLTPNDLGCTHAKVTRNRHGGYHVTAYDNRLDYHEHYSYDTDHSDNYVPGSAHYTDEMAQVLRKMGHRRT